MFVVVEVFVFEWHWTSIDENSLSCDSLILLCCRCCLLHFGVAGLPVLIADVVYKRCGVMNIPLTLGHLLIA